MLPHPLRPPGTVITVTICLQLSVLACILSLPTYVIHESLHMPSVQRTLFCAFCDEPADCDCALCDQSLCKGHAEPIDENVAKVIDSQIEGFAPEKTTEQYACPSCLDSFDGLANEPFPLP